MARTHVVLTWDGYANSKVIKLPTDLFQELQGRHHDVGGSHHDKAFLARKPLAPKISRDKPL